MNGTRFDEIAKALASNPHSRRSLLGRALKLSLAAVGSRFAGGIGGAPTALAADDSCSFSFDGSQFVGGFSTQDRSSGDPVTLDIKAGVTAQSGDAAGIHTTIGYRGDTLVQIDAMQSSTGPAQVHIHFGAMVKGVTDIVITSTDGKTFNGTVDGRALAPFTSVSKDTIRFADGSTLPDVDGPPGAVEAVKQVMRKAQRELGTCASGAGAAANAPSGSNGPIPADPATCNLGRGDNTSGSTGCVVCMGGCDAVAIGCEVAAALLCSGTLFGYFICLAAATIGCIGAQIICNKACHFTGAPCCPVACGNVACCFNGDSCLDSSRGVCCASGLQPCHGKCCCQPTDTCLPDGTCCPSGQATCQTGSGTVCCPPGSICNNGVCCPPANVVCAGVCCNSTSTCCGQTCCDVNSPTSPATCINGSICCVQPNHPCGNTCCPPFNACCNGVCCDLGSVCASGTCCPVAQACGGICCQPGQVCQNPSAGTCTACPPGAAPTICQNSSGQTTPACCGPNVSCCNEQCCPYASDSFGPVVCCRPVVADVAPFNNPNFGCDHQFACSA